MKKVLTAISLLTLLFAVSGCDFVRKMAGRPTSEEIAEKAARIKALEQARNSEPAADTLWLDTMKSELDVPVIGTRHMQKVLVTPLDHKYYVMLGTFAQKSNATGLRKWVASSGYDARIIEYENGLSSVVVDCGDDYDVFKANLQKIRRQSFCPKDICVLYAE